MSAKPIPQWQPGVMLQQARESLGYTKSKAASLAGISESRWRQIEAGARMYRGEWVPIGAPAGTLIKACRAVNLEPRPVLKAAGKMVSTDHYELRQALIAQIDQLNHAQLRAVDAYISGLLVNPQ